MEGGVMELFSEERMESMVVLERKERCKTCKYFHVLNYGSGSRFFYCRVKIDNRTNNGMQKIKANDAACKFYNELNTKQGVE